MTKLPESSATGHSPLGGEFLQEAVDLLTRLAGKTSSSDDPPALFAMADILAEEFRLRGLEVEVHREPDEHGVTLPVVEATLGVTAPPAAPSLPLLLVGHFDTVLPAATPRRERERLIATGAVDMKGGIVALLKALDLVAQRATPLPALRVVLVPDEEVGGAISRRVVAGAGAAARALWVLEPGEPRGTAETLVTGRRGMFHWRLAVSGRAAHSGLAFWEGRSAVAAAAEWIQLAVALSQADGGPTVNVARIAAGERDFVEAVVSGDPPASGFHFGTAHRLNVVPDRARIEGEARFLRSGEAEDLAQALAELARKVASDHQVDCDFTSETPVAPVDPGDRPASQAELAVRLAAAAGWELLREEDRGGISFPNFLPAEGRIPILDGLGPVGGGMHTSEEYVELRSLARRTRLLADLLEAEASSPSPR